MAFNQKKFLDALLQISASQVAPSPNRPVNTSFAKFMAAKTYGASDPTDAAIIGASEAAEREEESSSVSSSEDREEGALSKTFGWLMSPMSTVQNIYMDITDKEQQDDTSGMVANVGKDILAGLAHVVQPVAELAAIPGVKVPWEPESLSKFVKEENTEWHGTGPIHGSRILEERHGFDPDKNVRNALLGLGIDIFSDPLTYAGGLGLFSKAKKIDDVLDAAAATSKTVPSAAPSNAAPFKKPQPFRLPKPAPYTIPGKAPMEGMSLPNLATPKSVSGVPSQTFNDLRFKLGLQGDYLPESLRSMRASSAADTRWYEKLHPVVFPERTVPKNPKFASYSQIGEEIVQRFDLGEARAIGREEQVQFLDWLVDDVIENGINIGTKSAAERKYLMKGAEDFLESRGYTFPEGRLSQYLHHTKDASRERLTEFAQGKPLKERPMDFTMEQKLAEARKAQGRALLEAKLAKKSPRDVVTPFGINSAVVSKAIDSVATGADEIVYRIPEAKGTDVVKTAIDRAEKYFGMMGKTVGGVTRNKELNPANQANLYKQMWDGTVDLIRNNPEMLAKFTDKSGKIVHDSKAARKWRRAVSLSMLKTAENHLSKTHAVRGQHWDGSGLKLSAVIEELGPNALDEHITKVLDAFRLGNINKIDDPVVKEAIAKAIARRKLETGTVAKIILDEHIDVAKIMEGTVSRQKFLKWKNTEAVNKAKMAATAAGLSKEEVARVVDLVKNQVNTEGLELLEPMKVIDALGARTVQAVKDGTADHTLIRKLGQALQRAVNETPKQQRLDIAATTAVDTELMRWTTWYNRGEMIHSARERYSYLEEWAKARSAWFNNIAKDYSDEEVITAFKYAQGHFKNIEAGMAQHGVTTPIVDERVQLLGSKILDYFENIMASSRTINDVDALKGSVAVRAGAMMDDINKQLKSIGSTFKFMNTNRKNAKNVAGNPAAGGEGYGGNNWLASWENVDPTKLGQDPLHFMYDLSLAVDRVTTEYSLIDDFAMRFGRRVGDVDFDDIIHVKPVPHHRIDPDMKFDPKVADDFMNLLRDVEKGNWMPTGKFMRQMVKGQRMWKTGVTQYNPSFHIRNAIGDSFLMWAAGHNNPIYFQKAARMIAANRARYKEAINDPDLARLKGLMSREEYGIMQSKDTTVILEKYGAKLTSAEIYGEAMLRGQLLNADRASDIIGEPLFAHAAGRNKSALRRFAEQPLGGQAHHTVMKTTEIREHSIRLAHFTSAVNKGITKSMAKRLNAIDADPNIVNKVAERRKVLEPAYEKASQEVRKWHPDGRDLSYFEQKYMRQIIPFYSWQRKSLPLLIETMVTRPAKLTAYPKGMFAVQSALGIEAPGIQDPFPTDQLFPDWMRSYGIGPIGDPESDNAAAAWWGKLGRNMVTPSGETGYTVVNTGNPFNDAMVQFGGMATSPLDSLQKSGSLLSPYFNIPKEFMSDTKWTGAPISEEQGGAGYGSWLSSQIPILSMANRVAEVGAKPQETAEPGMDSEALINILTALGIKGSGQYLKSAEFDAKRAAKRQAEQNG